MKNSIRCDLAVEARELWRQSAGATTRLPGVEAYEEVRGSFKINTVRVLDERGAEELCKPIGNYITLELDGLIRREENAFAEAVELLSGELKAVLKLSRDESVLVVGLGNELITPDAVGPKAVRSVMVTRHLKERLPEYFEAFRQVAAIEAGVLGTTGIESAEIISALTARLKPKYVIAVDALAARSMDRLCRTLQLADTGIVPGSGVGNSRAALNRDSLGVDVIAIGVPTVVYASAMAQELAGRAGFPQEQLEKISDSDEMIVTPRDIDKSVADISKLLGYGINKALHDDISIEDIDMFLG